MRFDQFNRRTSILAGLPRHDLERHLFALQNAVLELAAGAKVVTASYAQGDGTKSVTYTMATMGHLTAMIKELQAQLGIIRRGRNPIRFVYR